MPQGIEVGDAVLKFLGDTTDLDAAYAKVDGTPARLDPARQAIKGMNTDMEVTSVGARKMGDVMDLAGEKTKFSMYEAKGEIGLLGEAIGVGLPRHVRSFVAELPGVGKAMTAAFTATAALFVIQAIIEATEKLTEWIEENYIFTESMKESNKMVAEGNKKLIEYAKELEKLKEAYRLIGLEGVSKFREETRILNEELDKQKLKFDELRKSVFGLVNDHDKWIETFKSGQVWYERAWGSVKHFVGAATAAEEAYQIALAKTQQEYIDQAHSIEVLGQKKKNLHKETIIAMDDETEKEYERGKAIQTKMNHEIEQIHQLELQYQKLGFEKKKVEDLAIDRVPMIVKDIETWHAALKELGVSGIGELERKIYDEQKAVGSLEVLLATKHIGTLHDVHRAKLQLIQDEIKLAKETGHNTKELEKQEKAIKRQIPEFEHYGKIAKSVADQVGHAVTQTAFAYGQGAITITAALRQITGAVISEIAKQAEVEGAKNLAKAFGNLGDYDYSAAGHHFAAAGAWFALAGGISMAAGAVSGGSATPGTAANPVNVTGVGGTQTGGAPKPIGGSNLQSFAGGGLITKPILAMMGDRPGSKGEVAFDLDDKRSIDAIREAMGGGGGHDGIVINFPKGMMISPDNLGKVVQKINRRIKKGQSQLTSSNTHRVTKRSV